MTERELSRAERDAPRKERIRVEGWGNARAEEVDRLKPVFEAWLAEHPEALADAETGQMTREGQSAARRFLAESAEDVVGRPLTEGAMKHHLRRWGYWRTKSQQRLFEEAKARGAEE